MIWLKLLSSMLLMFCNFQGGGTSHWHYYRALIKDKGDLYVEGYRRMGLTWPTMRVWTHQTLTYWVIALYGEDTSGGYGGIRMSTDRYDNSRLRLTTNDVYWLCYNEAREGWNKLVYDDTLWTKPEIRPNNGSFGGHGNAKTIWASQGGNQSYCRHTKTMFRYPVQKRTESTRPCTTPLTLDPLLDKDYSSCIPVRDLFSTTTKTLIMKVDVINPRNNVDIVLSIKNMTQCDVRTTQVMYPIGPLDSDFFGDYKPCDFITEIQTEIGIPQCHFICRCGTCSKLYIKFTNNPELAPEYDTWEFCEIKP